MAVDTEAKRASALSMRLTRMGIRRILPPPMGTVALAARAAVAGAYSGLAYGLMADDVEFITARCGGIRGPGQFYPLE